MSGSRQVDKEPNNDVKIDLTQIPTHTQDEIASATLDFIHRILNQPEGRQMLDARIAKKKAATAAQ